MRARSGRSTPDPHVPAETPVLAQRNGFALRTPDQAASSAREAGFAAQPSAVTRLLVPDAESLDPARRLVVLIPDADTDESALASQVWTLASARGLSILYLTLPHDSDTVYRALRRLAHLGAITRDDCVQVETRLSHESDWVRAVRALWRSGDLVVCHAEQRVGPWGLRTPLSEALVRALKAPVCILSGFYREGQLVPRSPVVRIADWVVPILIIALFFWLQVRIEQLPNTAFETILLISSVLGEFGLIWIWLRFTM